MNQNTNSVYFLSFSQLKDKAKSALEGNYKIAAPALFIIGIMSLTVQFLVQFLSSFLFSFILILHLFFSTDLTYAELVEQLESSSLLDANIGLYVLLTYIILQLIGIFLGVFKVGTTLLSLNFICGQPTSVSDIFHGFCKQRKKALKISALFLLVSQLYAIPLNYLAYLASYKLDSDPGHYIPAVIILIIGLIIYQPISLALSQSYLLLLDFPELSASEIIKRSNRLMKGNKFRLFLLRLSFLPLELLSIFSFRIGNLWLTPYRNTTYAYFFLNLMQNSEATQTAQTH